MQKCSRPFGYGMSVSQLAHFSIRLSAPETPVRPEGLQVSVIPGSTYSKTTSRATLNGTVLVLQVLRGHNLASTVGRPLTPRVYNCRVLVLAQAKSTSKDSARKIW